MYLLVGVYDDKVVNFHCCSSCEVYTCRQEKEEIRIPRHKRILIERERERARRKTRNE